MPIDRIKLRKGRMEAHLAAQDPNLSPEMRAQMRQAYEMADGALALDDAALQSRAAQQQQS